MNLNYLDLPLIKATSSISIPTFSELVFKKTEVMQIKERGFTKTSFAHK